MSSADEKHFKFLKLEKQLDPSFAIEVQKADEPALKNLVLSLAQDVEVIEETKKADATLNALKEDLKDLSGGYRDAKKDKTNRLKYILMVLEGRGKL